MLSVIIPTLNEAAALPRLLGELGAQQGLVMELLVADGGSTDGTQALATAAGAALVQAPRGRGAQMNAGARAARHDWLLFLHADSGLGAPRQLADAVAALAATGEIRIAGHFALRFERREPGHDYFFRYLEGKTRLGRPYSIHGDQGLLLPRAFFDELGGFDAGLPYFEDALIAERIFARGRWLLLPGELRSSARRFESEGHVARHQLMALMLGMQAAGLPAFFRRAPGLYRAQAGHEKLSLAPFFRLARELLRARGRRRSLRAALPLARANLWQAAYALDLLRADGELRWLQRYDRWLQAPVQRGWADALLLPAMAAWLYRPR